VSGFARCSEGHHHWGHRGAAGLLLARAGAVLLQLRAGWAHHGGTWSLPGGARERGETAVETALREATEELGLDRAVVDVRGSWLASCGGWTYETVLAVPSPADVEIGLRDLAESAAHAWVDVDEVTRRRLHPAFREAWADDDGALRRFVAAS
jgi:8-oxo-dGTP diphosphatase